MAKTNKEIVEDFYAAFSRKDFQGMISLYDENVHYHDPMFDIRGEEVFSLWYMMCTEDTDIKVTLLSTEEDGDIVKTRWVFEYTLLATSRRVVIEEEGFFRLEDGKITEHSDSYNFYSCLSQGLGFWGFAFGWTNWLKSRFRKQALKNIQFYSLSYRQEQSMK